MLTDAPVGILFVGSALDVIGQPAAADIAILLGALSIVAAALAGLADYGDTDGAPRTRATLHATVMILALVLYVVSLVVRAGPASGRPLAMWLGIAGFLVLAAGAYIGGHVAYAMGNMVSRHAFRGGGAKWTALEPVELAPDGSIPEGRLVKAKLGANQLVVIRNGAMILALHDTCAHAGGPLSEGALVGDRVECPWHGSQFRLADGHVVKGPSVYDQPAYEVRPREGGGWEARRRPSR
jgi:nitrite reductase/ring-hydroxylating ferredoxin subunit